MEKLWRKAQRTVGVLLAMAMLASAAPAQVLADDASSAADSASSASSESTGASSDSASSAASGASSASGDSASSASSESTSASSDSASSAASGASSASSDSASSAASEGADSQSETASSVLTEEAGTYGMSAKTWWGINVFFNNTTDERVHIYYSMDGREVKELPTYQSVIVPMVTATSRVVGIEFYIAVDEGFNYGGITFTGRSEDDVYSIDASELNTLDNGLPLGREVDFTTAVNTAKNTYHATKAFFYSGVGGLGLGCTGRRSFLVTTVADPDYTTIQYTNTQTDITQEMFAVIGQPTTVWNGVDEAAGVDWTIGKNHTQLVGWSEEEDTEEVQYTLDGEITPTDGMKLFTVWAPIQYQYKVEYYYDGEQGKAPNGEVESGTAAFNKPVTIDPPEMVTVNTTTYKLDSATSDLSINISEDESKNVLKVNYVPLTNPDQGETVFLTFKAGEHGKIMENGQPVTLRICSLKTGDQYPQAPSVDTETGWVCTGWYDEDGNQYVAGGEVTEQSESVTYTAAYEEDRNGDEIPDKDQTVTLTFDAGEHGTFAEGESGVYTRLPGEAYPEAPAVNVEEGWMLTGWYDANGNLYTAEGEVTDQSESATYTASYEEDRNGDNIPDKNQKYTITYTAGENGTVTVAKETAGIQGVAGIQGSKAVANTGYTVDGWYKGDVKITDGDTLTPDAIKANLNTENGLYKDTAFTARFVQLPQTPAALTGYTVRYLEDGTGYEVASPKTVSGVAVGTTVTETAPDLAGYSLMSDKNPQSITLSSGENVITFYYRAIGGETDTTTAAATPAPAAVPVIPTTPTAPAAPAATRAPAAAGPSVTAAPTTAPTEEPEEEVVPEEETPQAQEPAEDESIADEETPLAGSTASGWALLNLILTILTALGAVVLVVGYFMGYTSIWRLLSLIPGVGGVAAFLLTEDMSQAMTFVDGWTVLMVIIAVVQIVLAVLAMKGKNTYEENDEDEA